MAARNGASHFARGARSAFNSFRTSSSSYSTPRPPRRSRNLFANGNPSIQRRKWAQSMIPLHNAVASAKLVAQLSVTSRSSRALSRALQGYFYASYQFMPSVRGISNLLDYKPVL